MSFKKKKTQHKTQTM